MNILLIFFLCGFLTGCAVTDVSAPLTAGKTVANPQRIFASAEAIRRFELGISRQETHMIIGNGTTVGYELIGQAADSQKKYQMISIKNPFRSESIKKQNQTFDVDYYFTQINQEDGVITDDELTPLFFVNGRLAGKGWDFFNKKVKK